MTRLHKILLFSVIIAGIALRIVFILMNPQPLIHGDDLAYDSMGSNFMKWFLEDKNSLFGTSKPPLYPLFLHVVYSLFGHNVLHAYLSQAILDGFSMAAIFFICYSVFSSFR